MFGEIVLIMVVENFFFWLFYSVLLLGFILWLFISFYYFKYFRFVALCLLNYFVLFIMLFFGFVSLCIVLDFLFPNFFLFFLGLCYSFLFLFFLLFYVICWFGIFLFYFGILYLYLLVDLFCGFFIVWDGFDLFCYFSYYLKSVYAFFVFNFSVIFIDFIRWQFFFFQEYYLEIVNSKFGRNLVLSLDGDFLYNLLDVFIFNNLYFFLQEFFRVLVDFFFSFTSDNFWGEYLLSFFLLLIISIVFSLFFSSDEEKGYVVYRRRYDSLFNLDNSYSYTKPELFSYSSDEVFAVGFFVDLSWLFWLYNYRLFYFDWLFRKVSYNNIFFKWYEGMVVRYPDFSGFQLGGGVYPFTSYLTVHQGLSVVERDGEELTDLYTGDDVFWRCAGVSVPVVCQNSYYFYWLGFRFSSNCRLFECLGVYLYRSKFSSGYDTSSIVDKHGNVVDYALKFPFLSSVYPEKWWELDNYFDDDFFFFVKLIESPFFKVLLRSEIDSFYNYVVNEFLRFRVKEFLSCSNFSSSSVLEFLNFLYNCSFEEVAQGSRRDEEVDNRNNVLLDWNFDSIYSDKFLKSMYNESWITCNRFSYPKFFIHDDLCYSDLGIQEVKTLFSPGLLLYRYLKWPNGFFDVCNFLSKELRGVVFEFCDSSLETDPNLYYFLSHFFNVEGYLISNKKVDGSIGEGFAYRFLNLSVFDLFVFFFVKSKDWFFCDCEVLLTKDKFLYGDYFVSVLNSVSCFDNVIDFDLNVEFVNDFDLENFIECVVVNCEEFVYKVSDKRGDNLRELFKGDFYGNYVLYFLKYLNPSYEKIGRGFVYSTGAGSFLDCRSGILNLTNLFSLDGEYKGWLKLSKLIELYECGLFSYLYSSVIEDISYSRRPWWYYFSSSVYFPFLSSSWLDRYKENPQYFYEYESFDLESFDVAYINRGREDRSFFSLDSTLMRCRFMFSDIFDWLSFSPYVVCFAIALLYLFGFISVNVYFFMSFFFFLVVYVYYLNGFSSFWYSEDLQYFDFVLPGSKGWIELSSEMEIDSVLVESEMFETVSFFFDSMWILDESGSLIDGLSVYPMLEFGDIRSSFYNLRLLDEDIESQNIINLVKDRYGRCNSLVLDGVSDNKVVLMSDLFFQLFGISSNYDFKDKKRLDVGYEMYLFDPGLFWSLRDTILFTYGWTKGVNYPNSARFGWSNSNFERLPEFQVVLIWPGTMDDESYCEFDVVSCGSSLNEYLPGNVQSFNNRSYIMDRMSFFGYPFDSFDDRTRIVRRFILYSNEDWIRIVFSYFFWLVRQFCFFIFYVVFSLFFFFVICLLLFIFW